MRKASAGDLPGIQHDLIFVDDGVVKRWNRRSGRIESLLGSADTNSANIAVIGMRVNENLKRAVVIYSNAAAPGAEHVGLLDFDPLKILPVFSRPTAQSGPGLNMIDLTLSPDGKQLLAVLRDPERYPRGELVLFTEVGERKLLKTCEVRKHTVLDLGCGVALWTHDGQSVLWTDGGGFWRLDPFSGAQPVLISPTTESGQGRFMPLAMAQCPGIFNADRLSPEGKRALLIMPGYEWWHQGLLDIETQRCIRFDTSVRGHRPVFPSAAPARHTGARRGDDYDCFRRCDGGPCQRSLGA